MVGDELHWGDKIHWPSLVVELKRLTVLTDY